MPCIGIPCSFRMLSLAVQNLTTSYKVKVCHPEVFNTHKYTMMCRSDTKKKNFIMFIIVLEQHVSILIESSSGPSMIQILT